MVKGKELIRIMEEWAPPTLAVDGDRIGLQVGSPENEVSRVLVALEVTEQVVDEAIRLGANWIVAHHAVIFRPLSELRTDRPIGRLMQKLLANHINVYIAHTNLDTAVGGVNDVLVERLGLQEVEVLAPHREERLKKLVVFVPENHHESVLRAVAEAGAGWIGNYSHCTFNLEGEGTFLPQEGANPYIGKQGKLERVKEVRLETIFSERIQSQVIAAMLDAHPYEEVAYDIYPLENKGDTYGLGRVGLLEQEITLYELAERVKKAYQIPAVRFVGDPSHLVKKVAILGGAGSRYAATALARGADVFITGDIDYHTAQDALAKGLALLDPGHQIEHFVVEQVCQVLKEKLAVPIEMSEVETDPFRYL